MSRFYITKIYADGERVQYSQVDFKDGVNIIWGASNSGKSYVIGCINFMFGGDPPFTFSSTGYDTIGMRMETADGDYVEMERKIEEGKKGEKGAGSVKVFSSFEDVEDGDFNISKLEYNDLLLRIIGIKEKHNIISTQDYDTQNLTFRTLFHSFYIDEDNIFGKPTPIDVPRHSRITACISTLLFLLKGRDYKEFIPEETKEDRERKLIQKTAVVVYLSRKIQDLTKKREEMEKALSGLGEEDIGRKIDDIVNEMESIEKQIHERTHQSQTVLAQIYDISGKLEEARFLQNRYHSLRTQYASDIKRLRFIADGDIKHQKITKPVKCPFCDHEMKEEAQNRESYIHSTEAELKRITLQMEDLQEAENDIQNDIISLERQLAKLNEENTGINAVINRDLKPRANDLKQMIESYKRALEMRREIYSLEQMASNLNTDANSQDLSDPEDTVKKYNPRDLFTDEEWQDLSSRFAAIVKACAYPNFMAARVDKDTFDAVVNGKYKKDEGKGYRAFLNTIMLFNLMIFLAENGKYPPHMLILDSPILSLKEKKMKLKEKEKATSGMRASLFTYLIQHCGDNQIIISENELPETVDYSKVNMIEFTLDENEGRYGFLLSEKAHTEDEE